MYLDMGNMMSYNKSRAMVVSNPTLLILNPHFPQEFELYIFT